MSSWLSGRPSVLRMSPRRRIIGGWPALRWMSEASCFMTRRKSWLTGSSHFASTATLSAAMREALSMSAVAMQDSWGKANRGRGPPAIVTRYWRGVGVPLNPYFGAFGRGWQGKTSVQQAHRHAALGKVAFGRRNRKLVVMEDAGRQGGVGAAAGQH